MALGTPTDGGAAYSASGGTSVAPTYPASIAAGDCLVLIVGQKPSTANSGSVTTPTGWTLRDSLTAAGGYGATLGADTGNTNLFVYTKDTVTGSETGTLSVTVGTNNVCWGLIVRVPTGGGALSYGSTDGSRTTTPTSPMSIALAANPGFQTGDMALWAMCIPTDVTTPSQFSAQSITATGATFGTAAELEEPDSTTGNDIGGYVAYASVTSGTASGVPTVTSTLAGTLTNVRGPVVLLRIREAQAISFDAQPGSFTTTGQAATLARTRAFDAASGSLSISGQAAELTYTPAATNIDFDAQPGSFSLAGQAATLSVGRAVAANAGAFTLNGQAATLARSLALNAAAGALALTGSDAELIYVPATRELNAEAGALSISGQAATLLRSYVLAAGAGALADSAYVDPDYVGPGYVGGTDARLLLGRVFHAEAGSVVIDGLSATLAYNDEAIAGMPPLSRMLSCGSMMNRM